MPPLREDARKSSSGLESFTSPVRYLPLLRGNGFHYLGDGVFRAFHADAFDYPSNDKPQDFTPDFPQLRQLRSCPPWDSNPQPKV